MISPKFTPKQNLLLEQGEMHSLYDFITYLPIRLKKILPFISPYQSQEGVEYSVAAKVTHYTILGGKKRGTRLTLATSHHTIQGYCFLPYRFIHSYLQGEQHHWIIQKKKGFWSVLKVQKSPHTSQQTESLQVQYRTYGPLRNSQLHTLHTRLSTQDYILDVRNLLPTNLLNSSFFSLEAVHKPKNEKEFYEAMQQWYKMQAFLQLVQVEYFSHQMLQGQAKTIQITNSEIDYLIHSHPYSLTQSQIHAISQLLSSLRNINYHGA